jgi:ADP-ribose pyrophosphatase YjhB (NUDIX family)
MIFKSFVLIENDGKYLLIKEAAAKWNGKWFLPGGKVELGEKPEDAAHREVKEEAGCNIKIDGLFYFRYNEGFLDRYLAFFIAATMIGETIKTVADKHSLDVKWYTYDEIKTLPVRQKMLEIIDSYKKGALIPVSNFKFVQ